jgi:hypothetical protein
MNVTYNSRRCIHKKAAAGRGKTKHYQEWDIQQPMRALPHTIQGKASMTGTQNDDVYHI